MAYNPVNHVSVLSNTSGGTKTFSFIPPHGVRLANNEEVTIFGDISDAIASRSKTNKSRIKGFIAALTAGDITILSTPLEII